MPESALAIGYDLRVLKIEEMGGFLRNFVSNGQGRNDRKIYNRSWPEELNQHFNLNEKPGHFKDFLMLKIRQRSALLDLNSHLSYFDYLKLNPEELTELKASLKGVGGIKFSKDYVETFGQEVIKRLDPDTTNHLRIWIPGAGTGEYCYLFVFLLMEHLGDRVDEMKIQIFATDANLEQLQFAKKGIYPHEIFENIPEHLYRNYLIKYDLGSEVVKKVKNMILFSCHHLDKDPPLVKQDMIINLSTAKTALNDRILINLHYGLKKNAWLISNQKENITDFKPFFSLENSQFQIYRKEESQEINDLRYQSLKKGRLVNGGAAKNGGLMEAAMEKVFAHHNFPLVVIDNLNNIIEIKGDFKDYFYIPDGAINSNIINLVKPELQSSLRTLIFKGRKTGVIQTMNNVPFQDSKIDLNVYPLVKESFGIFFQPHPGNDSDNVEKNPAEESVDRKQLQQKLTSLKENNSFLQYRLDAYSEELDLSNEEIQELNLELQIRNSEMRQSNEELTASNEELQSANEELNTTITELKLANAELIEKEKELFDSREKFKESEELYRNLAQNFPNGIIAIVDRDLRLSFIEGKGLEDLGKNKAEVLNQELSSLFDTANYQELITAIKRTFKGKKQSLDFKHRDLFFTLSTIPLHTIADELERVMFVTQNITENKQLEHSLKGIVEENSKLLQRERMALNNAESQRNMLSRLFTQAPAAICILKGPELEVDLANDYFIRIIGSEQVTGKSLKKDFMNSIDSELLDKIEQVYQTGEQYIGDEVPLKLKGKDLKYYNLIYQAMVEASGESSGVVIYAYEVTALVTARKVIEENAIKLRMLLESLPQMAWTAKPDGYVDYVNQRWLDYTGLSYQDSISSNWRAAIHADDLDTHLKKWKYSILNQKSFENESRFRRNSDNSYRWHIVRSVPICNDNNEVLNWVGTCTDIDDQKRLEEKKDEFFSIASHELKTPLTSVKAYVQLIDELVRQSGNETLDLYLKKAIVGVNKLNKLINDLLDISRTQAGKVKFRFDDFDFDQLAMDMVENMQHFSQRHQIVLEGKTSISYYGDRLRLEQVFSNFISNAIKYSPESDKIIVKLACLNEQIIVSFTDFGIGIDKEKRERLFERYYRGEEKLNTTTGLGIGLYITAEIIKRHGGHVWVESEKGKGSIFYFSLPLLP